MPPAGGGVCAESGNDSGEKNTYYSHIPAASRMPQKANPSKKDEIFLKVLFKEITQQTHNKRDNINLILHQLNSLLLPLKQLTHQRIYSLLHLYHYVLNVLI